MRNFWGMKCNIVKCLMTCLVTGILIGGMGVDTCAAEVVGTQSLEEKGIVSQNVSCTVEKDGTVTYTAVLNGMLPVSDDGMLYLFALAPYEYAVTGDTDIIDSKPFSLSETVQSFTFPVNFRQEDTRLYSKFAMGIKSGGVVYMVTEPTYITNPEALAWNTLMRQSRSCLLYTSDAADER